MRKDNSAVKSYINYSGKKESILRDYIVRADEKRSLGSFSSNKELLKYIKDNYYVPFKVNGNTFRKIVGEVKESKNLYTEIQGLFLKQKEQARDDAYNKLQGMFAEQKEQARARTYEEIKQLLSDRKLGEGMNYLWQTAETEELCGRLGADLDSLKNVIYLDMDAIMGQSGQLPKKELDTYMTNAAKALKNNNWAEAYELNNEMFTSIKIRENYLNLETLINASNVYTGRNNIILRNATASQLETVIKHSLKSKMKALQQELNLTLDQNDADGQMSKLIVLSDGKKMITASYDANGVIRTNDVAASLPVNNESIFSNIIKSESSTLATMSRTYKPQAIISALKENCALAEAGSPNNNFKELVEKNSK